MKTRKYEANSMNGQSPGMYAINEAVLINGVAVGGKVVAVLQDATRAQAEATAASLQAQYDRLAQGV